VRRPRHAEGRRASAARGPASTAARPGGLPPRWRGQAPGRRSPSLHWRGPRGGHGRPRRLRGVRSTRRGPRRPGPPRGHDSGRRRHAGVQCVLLRPRARSDRWVVVYLLRRHATGWCGPEGLQHLGIDGLEVQVPMRIWQGNPCLAKGAVDQNVYLAADRTPEVDEGLGAARRPAPQSALAPPGPGHPRPPARAPLYSWFTEGLDTPDLQEARAVLHTRA
jgi:hypothetical protein